MPPDGDTLLGGVEYNYLEQAAIIQNDMGICMREFLRLLLIQCCDEGSSHKLRRKICIKRFCMHSKVVFMKVKHAERGFPVRGLKWDAIKELADGIEDDSLAKAKMDKDVKIEKLSNGKSELISTSGIAQISGFSMLKETVFQGLYNTFVLYGLEWVGVEGEASFKPWVGEGCWWGYGEGGRGGALREALWVKRNWNGRDVVVLGVLASP